MGDQAECKKMPKLIKIMVLNTTETTRPKNVSYALMVLQDDAGICYADVTIVEDVRCEANAEFCFHLGEQLSFHNCQKVDRVA